MITTTISIKLLSKQFDMHTDSELAMQAVDSIDMRLRYNILFIHLDSKHYHISSRHTSRASLLKQLEELLLFRTGSCILNGFKGTTSKNGVLVSAFRSTH